MYFNRFKKSRYDIWYCDTDTGWMVIEDRKSFVFAWEYNRQAYKPFSMKQKHFGKGRYEAAARWLIKKDAT